MVPAQLSCYDSNYLLFHLSKTGIFLLLEVDDDDDGLVLERL